MTNKIKFLLITLAIAAGFLVSRLGIVIKNDLTGSALIINSVPSEKLQKPNFLTKDSDNDGLPDREEVVYGTNPLKADTDGDGYLDGEEIATKHSPLNPKDSDKTGTGKDGNGSTSANFTNRVADLAAASLLGDDGKPKEGITQKEILNSVQEAQKEMQLYFALPIIKDSEIKIVKSDDKLAAKNYLSQISPVIEEKVFTSQNNIATAISSGGRISKKDYEDYLIAYNALKDVAVPLSWKEIHKKTLNNILGFYQAFDALSGSTVEDDPLKASVALGQIQNLTLEASALLNSSAKLMKSQGIESSDLVLNLLAQAK